MIVRRNPTSFERKICMEAILAFVQELLVFLQEGKAAEIIGMISDFIASLVG